MKKIARWFVDNFGIITTAAGCGCFVKAIVEAVRATPKAVEAKGDDEKTPKEVFFTCAPYYISTVAWAAAGVSLSMTAAFSDKKRILELSGGIAALEAGFADWREKARAIAGKQLDKEVRRAKQEENEGAPQFDEKQTFYIIGQPLFESTLEKVYSAEYLINRTFALRGDAMLNELYFLLGLPETETGEKYGWDMMSGQAYYGYGWIDFKHKYFKTDDGMIICEIRLPFGPHPMFEYDNDYDQLYSEAEEKSPFRDNDRHGERSSAKKTKPIME